jgi:two-component system sensor histidine kinase UhpB
MVPQLANQASTLFSSPGVTGWNGQTGMGGLEHLRHIHIGIYNSEGVLVRSNGHVHGRGMENAPPEWFENLMTRNLDPVRIEQEIDTDRLRGGKVVIAADPSYEVAEVWKDTFSLFWLVAGFFLAVNVLVFWAVGRALKPVGRILDALNEMERGNLDARLPRFDLKEMASISDKFNGMAKTLQTTITRNHRLSQQLIYLQEEERKSLARDLHDELGQCLTAIMADGTALLRLSESRFPEARASAEAVVGVTQQVMTMLRAMLQRLRPDVLDGLGLRPAIDELVANWRQRNGGIVLISRYSGDLDGLSDALRITAYRVVQECLTNISRHAMARRVMLAVGRASTLQGTESLTIEIEDDGRGFDLERSEGFGLSGMRERVEGLGGVFRIESRPGHGTRIAVSIPVGEEGDS